MSTPSVHLAVLVVATDPAKADLGTAMIVRGRANGAGHQIVQQTVTKDAEANIRSNLARWIDDPNIDVILIIGAVESDAVPSAIKPLVTQKLEGFTDLFRYLAFQEMGAGAMLSNAEAAQCNTTFVFVLPGGVGAVGTAMDKLIIPQLDRSTQPKNLVAQMPRLKNASIEEIEAEAVPDAIAPEKTAGGSGLPPKLPARPKPGTAKNVIRRPQDDPPTKQIDVAKLERQLANTRSPNDAQTKPAIDIRKMLPKLPPGADGSVDTDTDVNILAAPPPPLAGTARIDTSPPIPPPRPAPSSLPSIKGNAFNAKEGTSPGTPPPRTTGAKTLVGMPLQGNAFEAKEGTSPGAAAPAKPTTGTRSRPISVPPTNTFGKEGTSPGAASLSRPGSTATAQVATPFGSKEGTSSGAAPLSRPGSTATGQSVAAKDGTQPGATPPTSRTPAPPAKPARAPTSPPPTPAVSPIAAKTTPVAGVTASAAKEPSRPISSGMIGLPSSQVFAAASKEEAPKTNGAATSATKPSSASLTPSVEMAPLVEATLDEELEEDADESPEEAAAWARAREAAAEEAATVPRKREPTPPPPPVVAKEPAKDKSPPPKRGWEPTQKVDPMPMTPALHTSSGELPVGTFSYPVVKRSGGGALKWLLLLFALGAGFGAVVFVAPKLMKSDESKPSAQVAQTTPTPPPPPEAPTAAGSAEQPANTPTDTPSIPTADTPTTATTDTPDTQTPKTPTTQTKRGGTQTKRGGTTTPGPVTTPDKGTSTPPPDDKPVETKTPPPSGDPTCDEVSCVLSKYDRPCCERYKPKETDIAKRSGSLPEDLDRAAVRSGIEKVKPAVVQCGEKAGVKGTVKISVSVAPEGNVTSSEVAESPDPTLGSCVATAIKRAAFSKSINGGSFTYPFVF